MAGSLNGHSLSRNIRELLDEVGPARGDAVDQRLIRLVLDRHPRHDAALDGLLRDLGPHLDPKNEGPAAAPSGSDQRAVEEEDPERWSGLE